MNDLNPSPNLIIMGAQKSGTTSLYEYLKVHPEIFMSSPVKEPGFYLGEERAKIFWGRMGQPIKSRHELLHQRMMEGYNHERWFGDASTYYTIGQRSRLFDIPKRMHATNSDMRFIYILRNPIDRIVSNYLHSRTKERSDGTIEDFLKTQEGENALLTSKYQWQLDEYLKYFDRSQFQILIFEELLRDPAQSISKITAFLGIDDCEPKKRTYSAHNVSKLRDTIDLEQLKLSSETARILSGELEQDIRSIQNLIGREIDLWKDQ